MSLKGVYDFTKSLSIISWRLIMRKANTFVADELENKVNSLHKAVIQSEKIISMLEQENERLTKIINRFTEENQTSEIDHNFLFCN